MANVGRLVKESLVRDFSEQLRGRTNLFIASVGRLPAPETNAFRQQLSGSQARLIMIKRRLGRRALEGLKMTGLDALLEGSVGFVLPGEDVLPTAKVLVEFGKAHEEQFAVRGALIEGQLLDSQGVKALAALPPRPALLAQVLGTIEAPIAEVIFTIERLISDIGWIVGQLAEKKPATEAGTPPVAGSPTGVPGAAGERPTEAGTPPQAGSAKEVPNAVPRQDSGRRPEESRDAEGGGTQSDTPKQPEGGMPA